MKKKYFNSDHRIPLLLVLFSVFQFSCTKFVDAPAPTDVIDQKSVYSTDATAAAALTGIYTDMGNLATGPSATISLGTQMSLTGGLSADEFTLFNGTDYYGLIAYYSNQLMANGSYPSGDEDWSPLYNFVYQCNAAIEGINGSSTLSTIAKTQLLGEAKFSRAFFYSYLVNMFGDVPLALSTNYQANGVLPRASKQQIYQQMIQDLQEAQQELSNNYVDINFNPTSERVRPTSWSASALLARVYLYDQKWDSAEAAATTVINNSSVFGLDSLNAVFLKNSTEAIWQLQPITLYFNTQDAVTFIIPATGLSDYTPVSLSPALLNSFEPGDERAIPGNWIDSISVTGTRYYFPYKYKLGSQDLTITSPSGQNEYQMVLRLGEQYLIRAEARIQQNNIGGAQEDLNAIRSRAGLANTTASDQGSLLNAILHERQVELFSEWGHRWFDLKRTGSVDSVMNVITPLKANGGPWLSYQQLYPIHLPDLKIDPNLTQNPGY